MYVSKLRSAKVKGFESVKKIEMQVNKRRYVRDQEPIEFEKVYKADIEQRTKDQ